MNHQTFSELKIGNLRMSLANWAADLKLVIDIYSNPNATELERLNAKTTIAGLAINAVQIAAEFTKASKNVQLVGGAASIPTNVLKLAESAAALASINSKYDKGQATLNEVFLGYVDFFGSVSGLVANFGVVARNPYLTFWGNAIQAYCNVLREINIASSQMPNFFEWFDAAFLQASTPYDNLSGELSDYDMYISGLQLSNQRIDIDVYRAMASTELKYTIQCLDPTISDEYFKAIFEASNCFDSESNTELLDNLRKTFLGNGISATPHFDVFYKFVRFS
jgi:hypothetical protein